jgi:CheY-like chemotaxis protein
MTLRCLIVDDSPAFLDAATTLLAEEGIDVVGVSETGDDALTMAAQLHPDVILADIDMRKEDGFALAERLKDARSSPVILISAHAEDEFADMPDTSPAIGFISKASLSASAVERLRDSARASRLRAHTHAERGVS